MSWENVLKMPRVSNSGHEMVKVGNKSYRYRTFEVNNNEFGDFGYPKTAWIVSYKNEPINPIYNLKDAMKYIDSMIQDKHIKQFEHLRTDEEKERM